jgi:hypothetical protein
VCRDLTKRTQVWGDGVKAKQKQQRAIWNDVNKAVFAVSSKTYINGISKGRLAGLVRDGELIKFTPDRILRTAQEVVDFVDSKRASKKERVPDLPNSAKGITSKTERDKALKIKYKNSGRAKGAWIGAGKAIGAKQRKGSKITIGKKVAGYTHKFASGGTAQLIRSTWNPIGKIINNVPYVGTDYVLKKSDAQDAINQGGRMTIKWYESAIAAKLKRKNK